MPVTASTWPHVVILPCDAPTIKYSLHAKEHPGSNAPPRTLCAALFPSHKLTPGQSVEQAP